MPNFIGSWMSFQEIADDALERIRDIASLEINPETLRSWATQACRDFALRSECVWGVENRPMITSQQLYRLPADCIRPTGVAMHYFGWDGLRELPYKNEFGILDGYSVDDDGEPLCWFLDPERRQVGLYPIPDKGGYRGFATSAGNAGGTTLVCSDLSSTDDFYNGMELRLLDGTYDGEQQTIEDYDGTTGTVTVDTAFSGQIADGTRFEIHPDSLRIEYLRAGNQWLIRPVTDYAVQASPAPTYDTFALDLPDRTKDYWHGVQVEFQDGTLQWHKTRIVSSTGNSSATTVTVFPELPAKPTAADVVRVCDVPNLPEAWHPALVQFIVSRALRRRGMTEAADSHMAEYLNQVEQARRKDDPAQEQEYQQIREWSRGEGGW